MSYGSNHRNTYGTNCYSSNNQLYQIGNISYPLNKKTYNTSDNYGSNYGTANSNRKKVLTGFVTKLFDDWGLIDNEIQFSYNICSKGIPNLNDFVMVDATHSPSSLYKWRAVRLQIATNDRDFGNYKSISNSRSHDYDSRNRLKNSPMRNRERSRDRRYDDIDRKRFKRDDKEDKNRENGSFREKEKPKDLERSSPRKRSKTPSRRRLIRYAVKVPTELLNISTADIITLKKRYSALYIPSDFFSTNFCWTETFPMNKPFTLNKPCSFHVMHKDCDSYVKNDAVYDPPDADYIFAAKVMLMSIPSMDEVYKKCMSFAEDLHKDDDRSYSNLLRLIHFLVGSRGKNEPLAIGGPWSRSLDGDNPDKDPTVLIKTAIRTCKALTGVDLSGCLQWYRFMEVYYHRSESVHKGKTYPARVETVVFYLPEVWNCVPTCLEWDTVILNYKKILEEKLQPKSVDESISQTFQSDQTEESDKEEDLVVIDKCEEKLEATSYAELDPKNMKVIELRQELEARSLSTKGNKSQLITRLTQALKKEEEEITAKIRKEKDVSTTEITMSIDKKEEELTATAVKKEPETSDAHIKNEDSQMEIEDGEITKEEVKSVNVEAQSEMVDHTTLEKRYTLPEFPHIIVHPSRIAKSGKFDCSVQSLSNLLDYRTNENKEHSFELYLFAESFHEMIQRDCGFTIYKAFCEIPEKAKEEKEEKEQKKEEKNSEKSTNEDEVVVKTESKNEKENKTDETKNGKEKYDPEDTIKDDQSNKSESKPNHDANSKTDEVKKKEIVKLQTKKPDLLLAFTFFDRTHCGYIFDKDLETIFYSLGLRLSRHQARKLISKVAVRETVHYRKFTDKPDKAEIKPEMDIDWEDLALGNKKYLTIFADVADACEDISKTPSRKTRRSKNDTLPLVKSSNVGSMNDLEKITTSLKKSESIRVEIERQLFKCKKDYDSLKENLKRSLDKEKRINDDLETCRNKLMSANKEKINLMNKSKTYYKMLMNIKDQIASVEEKSEKNKNDNRNSKGTEKEEKTLKSKKDNEDNEEKIETKEKSCSNVSSQDLKINESPDEQNKLESGNDTDKMQVDT